MVYKHALFNELISSLFAASSEVEVIGRSDNVRDASLQIADSKAEIVLVEGNPSNSADLSLLNYLLVAAAGGPWMEMIIVSVESNAFATFYRGSIKHLDTRRLLSLVLAG